MAKEKKAKRNVWADDYRPYGSYRGARGNPKEWQAAFQARFSKTEIKEILGDDSPWKILGLEMGATQAEIKSAFRKKSMETHPDLNPSLDGSAFRKVKAAYDQLTPE